MPDSELDPTANTGRFRAFVQGAEAEEARTRSFAGPLLLVVAVLVALAIIAVIVWLVL